jgi:hypothetical protein
MHHALVCRMRCDMRGRIGNTVSRQGRQAALARLVEMVWRLDWGAEVLSTLLCLRTAVGGWSCWCWCSAALLCCVAGRCDAMQWTSRCEGWRVCERLLLLLLLYHYDQCLATHYCSDRRMRCAGRVQLARMSALLGCGCLSQQRALAHLAAAGGRRV